MIKTTQILTHCPNQTTAQPFSLVNPTDASKTQIKTLKTQSELINTKTNKPKNLKTKDLPN